MLNIVDLVVLACGAFVILNSIRVGVLRCLLDIAAFFISIYAAINFCDFYSSWVVQLRDPSTSVYAVTFTVVWFAAFAVLGILIFFFQKLIKITFFGPVEAGGGAILGIWKIALYSAFILTLLLYLPIPKGIQNLVDKSYAKEMATPLFKQSYKLFLEKNKKFPFLEEKYLKKIKVEVKDKEEVKIVLPKASFPKFEIPSIPDIDQLLPSVEVTIKPKKK